ncbi:MAG: hypothetical protein ABIE07_12515 [Candidatus Zixiibacteriota bacterium]
MMRIVKYFIIVCLIAGSASGQFLGQMTSADCLEKGKNIGGGYLIIAEDALGVVGSWRMGLGEYLEGRIRGGLLDPEGNGVNLILGADAKYQLWEYIKGENPFDMSLGTGIEYSKFDNGKLLGLTGSIIGSHLHVLKGGQSIESYAQLHLRLERISTDDFYLSNVKISGGSDSKLRMGGSIGAVFSVMSLADFTIELQLDDQFAIMAGLDLFEF